MKIRVQASWELVKCPECQRVLPSNWDWDVRSLVWLHDQPRKISPSNNDLTIHDGGTSDDRRNRFLTLEFKRDGRALSTGQERHLFGLSRIDNHSVLLVRGKQVDAIVVQQAMRYEWGEAIATTAESLNKAIARWLNGALWRDAAVALTYKAERAYVPAGRPGHTHGYAKVLDVWTCVQDYYSAGNDPDSGCRAIWKDDLGWHDGKEWG